MARSHELDPMPPTHPMLSDAEYKAKLAEMATDRTAGFIIMKGVIRTLLERKIIKKEPLIHIGWDLHFFFPTDDPHQLLHFQLHTLRENITSVNVTINVMKKADLEEIRKRVSIGSEETAVTERILNRAPVPFSQVALVGVLEQLLKPEPLPPSKQLLLRQLHGALTELIAQKSAESSQPR